MQADNNITKLRELIQTAQNKAKESLIQLEISRVQLVKDQNLTMKFCLTQSLAKKINHTQTNQEHKVDPFLNPDPALVITKLGDSHLLLFNKFNIFKNHLLVVTQKFQSQKQKLNLNDVLKSTQALLSLKGILFFNGGSLSGASQPVKHLQVLPEQAKDLPIFSALQNYVKNQLNQSKDLEQNKTILKFPSFKFQHGIIAIKKSQHPNVLGKDLFQAYDALHNKLVAVSINGKQQRRDYNMIASDSFIAIFIRKKEKAFNELSVNSVGIKYINKGYLGSVLFKDTKLMEQFLNNKTISPTSILTDISMSDQT